MATKKIAKITPLQIVWWCSFMLVMFTETMAGPIRYYLSTLNLEWVTLIPKLLLIMTVVIGFSMHPQKRQIWVTVMIFLFFSIVALMQNISIIQVIFGLTFYIPIIYGVMFYTRVHKNMQQLKYALLFFSLVASLGLILNVFIDFAWGTYAYQMGDKLINAGRTSGAFGAYTRPPGFSRMSSIAGAHVMVSSVFVLPMLFDRSKILGVLYWLLSLVSIFASMTKAALIAFLFASILLVVKSNLLKKLSLATFAIGSILLPFSTIFYQYSLSLTDSLVNLILFASFEDRLVNTWPNVIHVLHQYGNLWFGRGLSGLGGAQRLFGSISMGPVDLGVADNLPLYLYGNFGFVGIFIFIYLYFVASKLLIQNSKDSQSFGATLVSILIFGVATDSLENLVSATIIGIALGSYWMCFRKSRIVQNAFD